MKNNNDRFKLDNSAIVYPSAKTRKWTAMFRLSTTLNEDIDVEILKIALKKTLERLPCFSTTLKKGFFWHYYKKIDGIPPINEDVICPMETLNIKENNGFLFRVRYHKNTVAFEYFHALTDGTGGFKFMLTTICEYLKIKYNEDIEVNKYVLDVNESFSSNEYRDDFHKYSRKSKNKYNGEDCYVFKGHKVDDHNIIITSFEFDTNMFKDVAKSYNATIGELLTSIMAYSLYLNQLNVKDNKPIKVAVPVNLRYIYPSNTFCNFTTFVTPSIRKNTNKFEFDDVINIVKNYSMFIISDFG